MGNPKRPIQLPSASLCAWFRRLRYALLSLVWRTRVKLNISLMYYHSESAAPSVVSTSKTFDWCCCQESSSFALKKHEKQHWTWFVLCRLPTKRHPSIVGRLAKPSVRQVRPTPADNQKERKFWTCRPALPEERRKRVHTCMYTNHTTHTHAHTHTIGSTPFSVPPYSAFPN